LYFKEINIPELSSEKIERNIRLLSLKRHTSLDFKYVSTYINEPNKFFLGYENKNRIDLLRISSPFEKLLPKMIVTFKKNNFKSYKLRFKLISMILIILLTTALVLNIFYSIKSGKLESDFILILFLNLTFYLLAFVEYKLVNKKIEKTINWNK
jgi:hypothetical protein